MSIVITTRGSWTATERFLRRVQNGDDILSALDRFGVLGVEALRSATPVDTGITAASWTYEIVKRRGYYSIRWFNNHNEDGRPVAILLQYGHGTRSGGFVQGRNYIMPAIQPIFDEIDAELGKVVRGIGNH